jgi:hypothetical protein
MRYLIVALLLLAGCVTSRFSWTHPEGMQSFQRDSDRCEKQADRAVWGRADMSKGTAIGVGDTGYIVRQNEQIQYQYKRCMWDKGYNYKK